jgi:hypothetical protein
MDLTWDITRVRDYQELMLPSSALTPVTEALVWASTAIDLGHISQALIVEWRFRTAFFTKLFGTPFILRGNEPSAFTEEELLRHIGLRTNVETLSRPAFMHKCLTGVEMEVIHQLVMEDKRGTVVQLYPPHTAVTAH